MKIPIFTGPTAVGKSDFAVEFAKRMDGEIVSVDSMQIYKHMDVGTSKVGKSERLGIPHHMIDILEPDEEFDVEKFRKMVIEIVEDIIKRGKRPILVGGSGLYVEAVKYGMFKGPSKDEKVRESLRKMEKENPGTLRRLLKAKDPIAYSKFDPNDMVRIIRALEVYIVSGKTISSLWSKREKDERFVLFILNIDRKKLYDRINKRVDNMFKNGFVKEVSTLLKMGFSKDLPSMKSIGYKEVVKYVDGSIELKECLDEIKKSTRHYAKRQLTWFKKYDDAMWLDLSNDKDEILVEVLKKLKWGDLL